MLSPRARKAITILATVLAAFLLSTISLTYLMFFSPAAKIRSLEASADNNFQSAKELISTMSTIAEVEHRATALKKAATHTADETKAAVSSINEAEADYKRLKNEFKLSPEQSARIEQKIAASHHLKKSIKSYSGWLKEAKIGVKVLKLTQSSLEQEAKGLELLNQAITQVNSGDTKSALTTSEQVIGLFIKASDEIAKAQSAYRNPEIAQLKLVADYYIAAGKTIQQMAKADPNNTDAYNKYVEDLNKSTKQAAKMATSNLVTKDLNGWLEKNFYYEGGQLIFHYKKAVEEWPN